MAERDPSKLKVYIAVRDDVPDSLVPLVVAHAILSADIVFSRRSEPVWALWKEHSFKKVIVRVDEETFDTINDNFRTVPCYEENVLGSDDCVTVVLPMWKDENRERARYLRELPLWAVKGETT